MTPVAFVAIFLITYTQCQEDVAIQPGTEPTCVLESGHEGICKNVFRCPAILNNLPRTSSTPVRCEGRNKTPVVCCPKPRLTSIVMKPQTPKLHPFERLEKPHEFSGFRCGMSEQFLDLHVRGATEEPNHRGADGGRHHHHRGADGGRHHHHRPPVFPHKKRRRRYVVGGKESAVGEFPWMALVGIKNSEGTERTKWICDGVLVHPRWVITAAHCLLDLFSNYTIRLGEHDISSDAEVSQQDLDAAAILFHPDFQLGVNYHDLALVKLSAPVQMTDVVMPVCLPWDASSSLVGRTATLAGWGAEMFGGSLSNVLRDVDVMIFSTSVCQQSYSTLRNFEEQWPSGIKSKYLLCAGGKEGGVDACQGDSGGPLVLRKGELLELVGLVSKGFGCGLEEFPGIYVNVRTYLIWICDTILQNTP